LELGTQAQINVWEVGDYRMAEMINRGIDLHMLAASVLEGWDYEWAIEHKKDPRVKETRQLCKIPNFGYPGGMQAAALVPYARRQISPANPKGIQITQKQAERLYQNWRRALPFAYQYTQRVRRINRAPGREGRFQFLIPGTKVLRGNATYTSACNGKFQSLGARSMKRAFARAMLHSWTKPKSPIYRVPIPFFVHDELGVEVRLGREDEVMRELNRLILRELSKAMPDVKFSCEYVACDRWSKGAEPTFDAKGRLLVTEVKNVF
jgi:DNA polymerase I-like protein with 3'-5' exonuclease and polymerase domains